MFNWNAYFAQMERDDARRIARVRAGRFDSVRPQRSLTITETIRNCAPLTRRTPRPRDTKGASN